MATVETPPPGDIPFVTEQIAQTPDDASEPKRSRDRGRLLRPILWRLHFLGGLLVAPIVLSLVVSGILFAWNPQIDALRFGSIMGASDGTKVPLSQQVDAAKAAHPDWPVHSIVPGFEVSGGPDVTTAVVLDPPGGESSFGSPLDGVAVYVDEATGRAKGEIPLADMSAEVLRKLHSSWTLGPKAEPLTELAGSWFLISLVTGLYLWWPGLRRRGTAAFAFRRNMRGRRQAKDWHNFLGVALLLPMLFLVITGLTWTEGAGQRYTDAKETILSPPAAGSVSTTVEGAGGAGATDAAAIDRVSAAATQAKLTTPVRFVAPTDEASAWTVKSEDSVYPLKRDQIAVNASDGSVVDRFDYRDENWTDKLATSGILFHQAQLFGPATQVLMTILALAIAAMVAFGYRMWWLRRPAGG